MIDYEIDEMSHADREQTVREFCGDCQARKHGLTHVVEIDKAVDSCDDTSCRLNWRQRNNKMRVSSNEQSNI